MRHQIKNNYNHISKYLSVSTKMLNWLIDTNWYSYDPYDAGLSPIKKLLPKKGWWLLQHSVRLSPINLRPLLYIKKQIHPKGLAHTMQACLILSDIVKKDYMLLIAQQLAEKLIELASWHKDKCSWNYPFPYITKVLSVSGSTNIVNTSFVALALLKAYEKFRKQIFLDAALAASKFIIHDIGYHSYPNGRICFYYAPNAYQTLTIHNSNLVCASLLYSLSKLDNNDEFKQLAYAAALYTIDFQRDDGLWHYSERPKWKSVDCFHNGFILDTLMLLSTPECVEPFFNSLENGMRGLRKFLDEDGNISHFLTHPYPKDIRSYSQFIQTATLWSAYDSQWLKLANIVADNAIETMFSKQGYCYYRRYRGIAIKTPYIRWSVGPMLLALATFIKKINEL